MHISAWATLAVTCVVASLVIGMPGTVVALGLRLRGLWLASSAPLFGVSSIALATVWTALLGVRWAWWTVLITAVALAAIAFGLMKAIPTPRLNPSMGASWRWAPPIAIGIGVLLTTFRVMSAIGRPEWFDQAADNVFHLNVVQWILDHGDASPFDVMLLDGKTSSNFYPDAWHASVALVCQLTGAGVPIASNAVLIVTTCVVWTTGGVLLTRCLFGPSTPLLLAAGAVSAGFAVYPLLLLSYIGAFALIFSISLVPTAVAMVAAATGLARFPASRVAAISGLTIAVPGLGLAHPSALIMVAVMSIPFVVGACWRHAGVHPQHRSLAGLLALLWAVSVFALIIFVRPPNAQPDSLRLTTAEALGEVFTEGYGGTPIPLALAVFAIVGIVVALRRGGLVGWVAVGVWVAVSVVYIGATSTDEYLRLVVSGPWYADATRIAGFTPVAVVPLAARGAGWTWQWISSLADFSAHAARRRLADVLAVLLLGGLMVQSNAVSTATTVTRSKFAPTNNLLMATLPVSTDDRALLDRVPSLVPKDSVIAADPWTGGSFAYALTGRRALVPHMLAPITGQAKVFLEGISTSTADGPACRAARDLNVGWVLQLHAGKTLPNRPKWPGLKGLSSSPNMKLVDRVGNSSLYQIVGCGLR